MHSRARNRFVSTVWSAGVLAVALLSLLPGAAPAQDEPPLSVGLSGGAEEQDNEPALPAGLGGTQDEPALPAGLGEATDGEAYEAEDPEAGVIGALPFDLTGFLDGRGGARSQGDSDQGVATLGEIRAQIGAERAWNRVSARVTFDLLYDAVAEDHRVDLETGDGWFDLREAFVAGRVSDLLDLKLGRQILTWGTGDLIFINDLFPKDFVSFFVGRDTHYLKAPSDALKASFFTDWLNLDVVYTPRFDVDRHLTGRRVSFFDPASGGIIGRNDVISVDQPDHWFEDDEVALRLYRGLGALELRAYGYYGFWKSPAGADPIRGRATFPRLAVYGASARTPFAGGIASTEVGYYDSRDDRKGRDPLIQNSEFRLLAGYERELAQNLTAGVQYYLEWLLDYGAYRDNLPPGAARRDEGRHTLTFRLTQLLLQQNLKLSLFVFWAASDEDAYLRPQVSYKLTDGWRVEVSANVFLGAREETFWGQFQQNTNVVGAVRFGF